MKRAVPVLCREGAYTPQIIAHQIGDPVRDIISGVDEVIDGPECIVMVWRTGEMHCTQEMKDRILAEVERRYGPKVVPFPSRKS